MRGQWSNDYGKQQMSTPTRPRAPSARYTGGTSRTCSSGASASFTNATSTSPAITVRAPTLIYRLRRKTSYTHLLIAVVQRSSEYQSCGFQSFHVAGPRHSSAEVPWRLATRSRLHARKLGAPRDAVSSAPRHAEDSSDSVISSPGYPGDSHDAVILAPGYPADPLGVG